MNHNKLITAVNNLGRAINEVRAGLPDADEPSGRTGNTVIRIKELVLQLIRLTGASPDAGRRTREELE